MIKHLEHMLVVANLLCACGIPPVRPFVRNLLKHLNEVHIDSAVAFNEFFKFLQSRSQLFLRMLVDVMGYAAKKFPMNTMIRWEPGARPRPITKRKG